MGPLRKDRIFKAICWVLAAVIAMAVGVFQIDRSARDRPVLARFVPSGLGGNADLVLAHNLALTDPDRARQLAIGVLEHRPVPATHLSTLALAAAELDDNAMASAALSAAGSRGWRDPFVQISILGSAVASQRVDLAVQRLEALIRARRPDDVIATAIAILAQDEVGRVELAKIIKGDEEVGERLTGIARTDLALAANLTAVIATAGEGGNALPCEFSARIADSLLQARQGSLARAAWGGCIGQSRNSDRFVLDGNEPTDPLAWRYNNEAGLSVAPGNEAGTLAVSNRTFARKQVAAKYLMQAPGSFTVSVVDAAESAIASPVKAQLEVRAFCVSDATTREVTVTELADGQFVVPVPEDCPVQQIRIFVGKGRFRALEVVVS